VCDQQELIRFRWWARSSYVRVMVTGALSEVCALWVLWFVMRFSRLHYRSLLSVRPSVRLVSPVRVCMSRRSRLYRNFKFGGNIPSCTCNR